MQGVINATQHDDSPNYSVNHVLAAELFVPASVPTLNGCTGKARPPRTSPLSLPVGSAAQGGPAPATFLRPSMPA